jgi:hypothetical protein
MDGLRHAIEAELESGEQVVWAARPSVRLFVLRKLPLLLVMVGGGMAIVFSSGYDIGAAIAQGGDNVRLIIGAVAALTVLAGLTAVHLRLKTVYAITDRRLLRTGGQSRLTNRPGQTFSYRPQDIRFLETSNLWVWRHVYIDKARWGSNNQKSVLIGFEDVPDPPAVHDRIRDWLDTWQQGLLSDITDVRLITNADHGFSIAMPAAWKVEVGVAVDADQRAGSPSAWAPELQPWDGQDRGWDRVRVTGPADIMLAIEAVRGSGRGSSNDMSPAVESGLGRLFGMSRETADVEFAGRAATVTTWSVEEQVMRVLEVPSDDVEFRIYLIAPAPLPRFMAALEAIASSFQLHDPRHGAGRPAAMSHGARAGREGAPRASR